VAVTGVACEPAEVRPGDLYIALRDGREEAAAVAVERGAIAVVSEGRPAAVSGVPVMVVPDAVRALGHAAARVFGTPARGVQTCGVTGTSGASAVARLAVAGLEEAGYESGLVSRAQGRGPTSHRLQRRLSVLRQAGANACVLEASSRDLADGRFEGMAFDSGVFLGLRRGGTERGVADPLDAKMDLFRGLAPNSVAALNRDDPAWELMAEETRAKVITFGTDPQAHVRARVCRMDLDGVALDVRTPVGTVAMESSLVGPDHVVNMVGALCVGLTLGADLDEMARGITRQRRVPNVLEAVPVPSPYSVFLDGARDPREFTEVLLSLRPLVRGRLFVVVGPPEDHDAERRAMAAAAERAADAVVVTRGPRTSENPMAAIGQMMRGFQRPCRVLLEPSRRRAVEAALEHAAPQDVVLLISAGDGALERRAVRDWFLEDLEAEAHGASVEER